MQFCRLGRGSVAQHGVRSVFIVVRTPRPDDGSSVCDRLKPVFVQTFITELAVKAFDVRVLRWFSGLNQLQLYLVVIRPLVERSSSELRALVCTYRGWISAESCSPVQDAGYIVSGYRDINHQVDGLLGAVINDGQNLDASPVAQRIHHEVHRPDFIPAPGKL